MKTMSQRKASPTIWLSSVEVENFRCFKTRQRLPFTTSEGKKAQWTLLLGENGTGKSTLLQLCAMLMPRKWEPDPAGGFYARAHIHDGGFLRWATPSRVSPQDDPAVLSLALMIENRNFQWSWEMKGRGNALSLEPTALPTVLTEPRLPLCLAYAPYRSPWTFIPEDTSPEMARGLMIGFTQLRHPGIWFKDRTLAAHNPDSSAKSKEVASAILKRVRETLIDLLPDVSDLRINTENGGRGASRLRAKTSFGWVDIDQLGMGYQSVLGLVVDIASRLVEYYPDSPNPLEEPAVVLIDEIDLHLHPKWQRTLQQQLSDRFPNVQFIATAHSPLVVQSSPLANIVVLRCDHAHDEVLIEQATDAVRNWRVDQILTSDLFGLPSARPHSLDRWMNERDKILGKADLSPADEERLKELREKIGELPGGETPWQMEAMELIQQAAKSVKATRPRSKRKSGGQG